MEEPIENPEIPETKEPVKPEPATSPADRGGAGSPTPECSICLGHLINTSFTDSCLHQFCFTCLVQWSKIKTECPLCKQTFKSIIHNVRSEEDYDQYHVPRELAPPPQLSPLVELGMEDIDLDLINWEQPMGPRRFAYRTTMTPNRRIRLLPNPTHEIVPRVSRDELRYRLRNPSDYRRNVYRHGEWSIPLPGAYAGALEHSADFFRQNPHELNRLIPWINRDLQILLNANEQHIAYVLRTVMDALTRHDLRSAEIRDLLRPYFGIHTDHFLHELINYARTGFEVPAYDSFITYPTHGLPTGYLNTVQSPARSSTSSSLTDDSDVRVVDHVGAAAAAPAVGPHAIDMPGPSTVAQAFQIRVPHVSPTIFTISSNESESECEVVGYVKPRHERTPEIIEIGSSDGEAAGVSTPIDTEEKTPRSPSPPLPALDEPSTSQGATRRNPRGARRKASISFANLSPTFSDSSDDDSAGDDWNKKTRRKRTRKTSKTCKKSPRKQSQKKDSSTTKKRSRKTSSSNDESHADTKKRRATKKMPKSRARVSTDSSSEDDENISRGEKKGLVIKIRKDLMNQNDGHTEDSSMSSSLSSSSASSDESASGSSASGANLPLKKRWTGRSRRKAESTSKKSKGKLKSVISRLPVDSTILRKDAMKKEWYIDKKSPRSPSMSDDEYKYDERLRMPVDDHKERKSGDEEPADDDSKRSNSQCSSRSDRNQDKYKSKYKSKHKDKAKDIDEPSTSNDKHSECKSAKKRRKTHKKHKSSKPKHSKGKSKRDKRHYSSESSLSLD